MFPRKAALPFLTAFVISVVLLGCQKQVQPVSAVTTQVQQKSPFQEVSELLLSFGEEKVDYSPNGLIYPDWTVKTYLFIKPKSEEHYYLSTDKFYKAFIKNLYWAVEYVPRDNESYNYDDYDYTLKTNDSYDIRFNSKTGIFYFENDKMLYKLWSEKSNLWSNAVFDKNTASVDFSSDKLIEDTAVVNADIDGDSHSEAIHLSRSWTVADSSEKVALVIDGITQTVFGDAGDDYHLYPDFHVLDSSTGKYKAVIVSRTLDTADWGAFQVFMAWKYEDKKLTEIPINRLQQNFAVKGTEVRVKYPAFHSEFKFSFDKQEIQNIGGPEEVFGSDGLLRLRNISFEKSTEGFNRLITSEDAEIFHVGYYYSVETKYSFDGDELIPTSVRFIDRQ